VQFQTSFQKNVCHNFKKKKGREELQVKKIRNRKETYVSTHKTKCAQIHALIHIFMLLLVFKEGGGVRDCEKDKEKEFFAIIKKRENQNKKQNFQEK